jgi:hypothetical protein
MKLNKPTRYTDSQKLRDALSFFGLTWGFNKAIKLQGLIDVLISMFLAGEISTDLVKKHYQERYEENRKIQTEKLLKNRFNK